MHETVLRGRAADAAWAADPYVHALDAGRGPLFLQRSDGWLLPLDVERWCAPADSADQELLHRCHGPVLDLGCGPGRLVIALARRGRPVLGVDISPAAVARAHREGRPVVHRSVFDRLPAEGRWGTVLLADGNIGIGGAPETLLTRARGLLAPEGRLLVEADAHEVDERLVVRVRDGSGRCGPVFLWARVGSAALRGVAVGAGWTVAGEWSEGGRRFLDLRP
ncbi:class I SAM-dependent DNA methyltransferase [Streptomyces sp. NBC_00872]|uniref:class I SAM-dependent DNA methyltransferase n=1 Tax=Streptomyces sp. NBC_00872 TaxID=2903686 RepID=UPI0038634885|nr:methyltransferase domain-containing protein [Streptomyces sp. NBC_00872]